MFKGNQFLNPDECDFEILGFYEELTDEYGTYLGSREYGEPDRPLGAGGVKQFELTENVVVQAGHKMMMIKASKKKPKKVTGILQIKCGRVKRKEAKVVLEHESGKVFAHCQCGHVTETTMQDVFGRDYKPPFLLSDLQKRAFVCAACHAVWQAK